MLHIVGEGDNFVFDLILDHIAVVMWTWFMVVWFSVVSDGLQMCYHGNC